MQPMVLGDVLHIDGDIHWNVQLPPESIHGTVWDSQWIAASSWIYYLKGHATGVSHARSSDRSV